jgi:hypothetical protein
LELSETFLVTVGIVEGAPDSKRAAEVEGSIWFVVKANIEE